MIKVRIRHNNKELVVSKEDAIVMSRQVAPFLKFDTNSNIISFTWTIPYTDEVAKFFGFVGTMPFTDDLVKNRLETFIEEDGQIITGLTEIKGFKDKKLTAHFISGNKIWWNYIEGVNLCELDFTESYTWDETHIEDNFSNGANDDTTAFVGSYRDQTTPYPIYWSLKGFGKWHEGLPNGVGSKDMRPNFWAKAIVDKIFKNVPVSVQSNFFESDYFNRVQCYMMDMEKVEFSDQYKQNHFNVVASGTVTSTGLYYPSPADVEAYGVVRFDSESLDLGNNFSSGVGASLGLPYPTHYSYRAPVKGTYTVNFSIIFTDLSSYPVGIIDFQVQIVKYNSTGFDNITINEEIDITFKRDLQVNEPVYAGVSVELEEGEYFWIKIIHDQAASGQNNLSTTFTYITNLSVIAKETFYSINHPYEVKRILPCTSAGDFLKGLTHAFNLQYIYDSQKRILTIEPYNEAYKDLSEYEDWSEIFDTDSIDIQFKVAKLTNKQKFSFIDDGINLENLYSYTKQLDKGFLERKVTNHPNPFFAATENYKDNKIGLTIIPKMWSADFQDLGIYPEQNFDLKPRLFHFKGYGAFLNENWIFNNNEKDLIPKAMQVGKSSLFTPGDEDLDFETLFNKFYAKNFKDIEDGSIVQAKVIMDLRKFKETDFRKPILIKYNGMNVYLRLLKIDQFKLGGDKRTKCKFIYWKG